MASNFRPPAVIGAASPRSGSGFRWQYYSQAIAGGDDVRLERVVGCIAAVTLRDAPLEERADRGPGVIAPYAEAGARGRAGQAAEARVVARANPPGPPACAARLVTHIMAPCFFIG